MAEDETPNRALANLSDQALAPARSLAERTLAALRDRGVSTLAVPRRLIVAGDGSAMFTTIGAAIAVAVDGDEIVVEPGGYVEHLTINRSIRIRGHGPREDIVLAPARGSSPCIEITGGSPHLTNLAIDSRGLEVALDLQSYEVGPCLLVDGGTPMCEGLDISGPWGVDFQGPGTGGSIRSCSIHDGISGFRVTLGAAPLIGENDIAGHTVYGLHIHGQETAPFVLANRIHHVGIGIRVGVGAEPRIEDNEIWASAVAGIRMGGQRAAPIVRSNRIHDGRGQGIMIFGASPRIEENEIWANQMEGLCIVGVHSSPTVTGNTVRDGLSDGIAVLDGASPILSGNTVRGNAQRQIRVADDANPTIGTNIVST